MSRFVDVRDMSRKDGEPLTHVDNQDLMPLPAPFDSPEKDQPFDAALRGDETELRVRAGRHLCAQYPPAQDAGRRSRAGSKFLSGLEKLFTEENNWTFLQPLI